MEIYDYYKLAAQQHNRNLAKNMIIKLEIYMTDTEESMKKSRRGSIASEAKEIHSSGALKSFKLVLEKCEKQSSREGERGRVGEEEKQSNHQTTRDNNK